MVETLRKLRLEFRPTVKLAGPLVIAELGWMLMSVVDTMMVGRLPNSAEAMGAVSLGGVVFYTVLIFGSGLLLGLDTLVSQSFGAGRLDDCHRWLISSAYLILPLAPALMTLVWLAVSLLRSFGIQPAVLRETIPYLRALNWSALPLLPYFALRRYLQGMGLVKPVTFALVSANLVNVAGNWVLIFGHLGAPAMGTEGAGWATCLSRIYMTLVLAGYAVYHDRRHNTGLPAVSLRPDLARVGRLLALGLPAATQLGLEVAVFATATALIGRLDAVSLAGHQIALNAVSVTYMVPLGIGSAAAVRVGHALGRRDLAGAAHAGWTALLLGAAFMACAGIAFLAFPHAVARAFTADSAVVQAGASLLLVAAFFQLFDGLQAVATGALRGAGDTRTPMFCHVGAYWAIGLPLGYFLCFRKGWGAPGLWVGLSLALILIGSVLLLHWRAKMRVPPATEAACTASSG